MANLDDSILETIKDMILGDKEEDSFDTELIADINAAFSELVQGGVGPQTGFEINDNTEKWKDFVTSINQLSLVKTYVYYKTKLMFSPPENSFTCEALSKRADEQYWRLYIMADEVNKNGTD